jgi:protein-L-isoaspartate(D-aspartate) O-methyltransferase
MAIDFAAARRSMVTNQLVPNRVTDERVTAAMGSVARELFVPEAVRAAAYADEDVALGRGRFVMEPRVFARLLQAAAVGASDLVLDVGCGTGYSSAVLAKLAATVVALEEDAELAQRATQTLARAGADNVAVVTGPMRAGYAQQGPYDVIFVNGAVPAIPDRLAAQLADGGRLVAVVGAARLGKATLVVNVGGVAGAQVLFDAAVPALPGFADPPKFVF